MSAATVVDALQERWRRAGFPPYPWWVPVSMDACSLLAIVVAAGQRLELHPGLPVVALALLAATPWLVCVAGWMVPWPVFTVTVVGSVAGLVSLYPVTYDFAALVLVMLAGHLAAVERARHSAAAALTAAGALALLHVTGQFDGASFAVAALVVGWDVGFLIQYQQRQLEEQVRRQQVGEERAALEERQRIAREVHDVIAHSLSVTLLHLTAARRSLEDDLAGGAGAPPDEADLAEAVDSLRDAERLGRQAMADIRRTVGLLGAADGSRAPAAGIGDVPALVGELSRAGLDVRYEVHGDAASVTPTTGLGVYRVVQESLSNVAKHQPSARVEVRLDLTGTPCRLTVRSSLAAAAPVAAPERPEDRGSGIRGMRERAELLGGSLSAGPRDGEWVVEMLFPPSSGTEVGAVPAGTASR